MRPQFWSGKKVLVTGGAGFIGSNTVARLLELGAQVRVVDNLERGKLENLGNLLGYIEFRQGDLRNKEISWQACQGVDIVIHLASKVGGINYYLTKPGEVLLQNTLIDTLVLEAAKSCGVQYYLYASSAHVYPIELQQRSDSPLLKEEEAIPAHPLLSYGWAKLLAEKQLEYAVAEEARPRVSILRLIGVYGKNQDLDLITGSAIPVFIRRAIEHPQKKPFVVLGSGSETRSYCYISDVLDAVLLSIEKLDRQELVGPLNIGSESRIRIAELAAEIIDISGKDIEIVYDSSHQTLIWGQALNCSKARTVLDGWHPHISLRQGLEMTYACIEERLTSKRPKL